MLHRKLTVLLPQFLTWSLVMLLTHCGPGSATTREQTGQVETSLNSRKKRPVSVEHGKIFEVDGKKMLYGGEDSVMHFDISDCELKDEQFHYGIGREVFPALLKPQFASVAEVDPIWDDTVRFLVAHAGEDIKAYSVPDLTRHEVVNDMLDGRPIMAAYCILANLGGIYERRYGPNELTFALSGYTYYDDEVWGGLDGFVFWDRETESLWWPLIGRSVSGPLKGVRLIETDRNQWTDTTWGEVKDRWPQAQVLVSGQDYKRPTSWAKLGNVQAIRENFMQKR